jgi:hypothetical protein
MTPRAMLAAFEIAPATSVPFATALAATSSVVLSVLRLLASSTA